MVRSLCLCLAVSALLGCGERDYNQPSHAVPGGNVERGRSLIASYGCGTCHDVPGVARANGTVGPPLEHWDRRMYIAGILPNRLEDLTTWIMHPQQVIPGNAMPDMNVTSRDAYDIAAYLYTLR
jgi:cytochrome c2